MNAPLAISREKGGGMDIVFSETREFGREELEELFLSAGWDSGKHPDRLLEAMKGAHAVFSARDDGRLVGVVSAISDGAMVAYIPYMLVRPGWQGKGVGRALLEKARAHYADLPRLALISYDAATGFYEKCGFVRGEGKTPMFVTSLGT